jgi:hypothetical protein
VIVPAEDVNSLPMLETYLPQGQIVDQGPLHYGLPYFLVYRVPAGARAQIAPGHVQRVEWSEGDEHARFQLWGYDLDKTTFAPGEVIHVTLYYGVADPAAGGQSAVGQSAADQPAGDYTGFVHLLGPLNPATGGPLWAQDDSEPCRRSYRTSAWRSHEIVLDRYAMTVPLDAPAGEYEIEMGFYRWDTLVRLPVLDDSGQPAGDHVILAQVTVTGD